MLSAAASAGGISPTPGNATCECCGGAQDEVEKAQCLPALLSLQEAGSADERLGAMACLAQLLPAAGAPAP